MTSRVRSLTSSIAGTLPGIALLLASGAALAQGEKPTEEPPPGSPAAPKPPETAPPAALAPTAPTPSTPGDAATPSPAAAAAPTPGVVAEAPAAPASAPAPAAPPPPPAAVKWWENLKITAFADAYYSYNFNQPHPEFGGNSSGLAAGGSLYRAYDFNNGFSLHWAGVDATYAYDNVGGTVSLRLGPSTVPYNGNDIPFGGQFVKQAFATWKPLGATGALTIDFGKYDQPFGSEVADSQLNVNYTRTFLYWLAQPLYFTGLRADYAFSPEFDLKLFAINGWNRLADNNAMKDFGAQIMVKPADQAIFYLGYMFGAEQPDVVAGVDAAGAPTVTRDFSANSRYRHFVDFVADINPTPEFRVLANADYGTEDMNNGVTASWYGANLVIGIKPSDRFLIAPRGEVYVDDSFTFGPNVKRTLYDATLTLGYIPSPNFLIKLDVRGDFADKGIFLSKSRGTLGDQSPVLNKEQYTATLGVVATTN